MTPNPGSAVWTMASFLTLFFAWQVDSPCPVVMMQYKKMTIQRLDLAVNPRKPATHSACAVLNVHGS